MRSNASELNDFAEEMAVEAEGVERINIMVAEIAKEFGKDDKYPNLIQKINIIIRDTYPQFRNIKEQMMIAAYKLPSSQPELTQIPALYEENKREYEAEKLKFLELLQKMPTPNHMKLVEVKYYLDYLNTSYNENFSDGSFYDNAAGLLFTTILVGYKSPAGSANLPQAVRMLIGDFLDDKVIDIQEYRKEFFDEVLIRAENEKFNKFKTFLSKQTADLKKSIAEVLSFTSLLNFVPNDAIKNLPEQIQFAVKIMTDAAVYNAVDYRKKILTESLEQAGMQPLNSL